jgi:hypothetical protein
MNIVGEGINKTISEQIRVRQEKYSSGLASNRDIETIEFFNSRTAFVKLISSVDIVTDFNPKSQELKDILSQIGDNKLATEFVLFNGTSTINPKKNSITQRSGIARTDSVINNKAYGLGGLEFGLRPMPGIISMETKTENRGSLRTSTVRVKAWNRVQFEILDILYLRLGYSVLLEFGNILYFQNDGTLIKNRPWSLQSGFLKGSYDVDTLQKAISDFRIKSNGNYDAVFGKVTNYSWSFETDGSYDITITIKSIGDVIESLKLNTLIEDKSTEEDEDEETTTEEPTIESFKDKHQIGRLFYNAKKALSKNPQFKKGCRGLETDLLKDITFEKTGIKHFLQQNYNGTEPQYYIRLGSLLAFIQAKVYPKYTQKSNSKIPLLKYDYKIKGNLIYTVLNQVSMDPRVCLINTSISTTTGEQKDSYVFAPEGEEYVTTISNIKVGQVMNIYVNMLYILKTLDANLTPDNSSTTIDFLNSMLSDISKALGSINTLEAFRDDDTNEVKIIDQSTIPGKYELMKELERVTPEEINPINLYGYVNGGSNFVRNFGIKTEITPNLSTTIAIGAQAAGTVIGEDSTALSRLNLGLEDRIKNTIEDAITETTEEKSKEEELNDRFPNVNKNFTEAILELGVKSTSNATPTFNEESIDSYSQVQANFLSYINAKTALKSKKASSTIGFLPVNLNLTLDGISGLKIYNALNVDTRFLPSNYPETMDFIIVGLNHKVENNDWTTSIETNMVPKDPSQGEGNSPSSKANPAQSGNQSSNSGNSGGRSGGSSSSVAYFQSNVPEAQAKLRARLTRILDDGTQTLGLLTILAEDGVTELYTVATVELPYKNNENGASCVPTGTYLINSRQNSKYGKHFWLVGSAAGNWKRIPGNNNSDRTWVLIHKAPKAPGWLQGCIGPGPKFNFKNKNAQGNPNGVGSAYLDPAKSESQKTLDRIVNTLFNTGGFKMTIVNGRSNIPNSIDDPGLASLKAKYPKIFS